MAGNGNPYEQPPHQPYVAIPPPPPPPPLHHNPFPQPLYYHNNPFPLPPSGVYHNLNPLPPPGLYHYPNQFPPVVHQKPYHHQYTFNSARYLSSSSMAANENPTLPTSTTTEANNEHSSEQAEAHQPNLPMEVNINAITIEKEETKSPYGNQHHYTVTFFDRKTHVTVTCSSRVAKRWVGRPLHRLKKCHRNKQQEGTIAGFGVQWKETEPCHPATALQICVEKHCLIFLLERARALPDTLLEFLNSVKLVGIKNRNHARSLKMSKHNIDLKKDLIDISYRARRTNGENFTDDAPYEEIVSECLGYQGVGFDNAITTSNWNVEEPSLDQVLQASVDAFVSFLIGKEIKAWNFNSR